MIGNVIRETEILKNNKFRILLCVELVLLLIGVPGLLRGEKLIAGREDTDKLLEEGVSVPAGVYTMKIYYDAGESGAGELSILVPEEEQKFNTLLANVVALQTGIHERECQFYLWDSVDCLKAGISATEDVQVQGLELYAEASGSRIYLFWLVLGILLVNGGVALAAYHKKRGIPADRQLAFLGIPLLVLVSSLPSLVDYNIIGADLVFHMMRIEALADSICRGELSCRIESMWMAGHGYANSIFYGDICLALPALLRIMGFPMDSAYRIFLVSVNLATALVAYVSFCKCFNSRLIGMFGCALYTLAPYRMYNMYNRAAVGEFTAMIFLPLLAWGFYKIYTEDTYKKGYLWNWAVPVIGFSGIIQSHLLTCEMAGFFVALLCLLLWKKTFRRRTFLVLCSTVIMTIVINAWFLVPCIDLMVSDQYAFGGNSYMMIQKRGILPAQIFYTLQAGGTSSRFVENGMIDTEPIGMGAALLLCIFLWLLLYAGRGRAFQTELQRKERRAGNTALLLTGIALFMSTCYFPWDFLSSSSRVLATLAGSLQFPTRITAMVTILAVFVACVMGVKMLREGAVFLSGRTALLLIALAALLFGNYQVNDILLTRQDPLRLYTAQNVGTTAVLGAEYLPRGADIGHMTYHAPVLWGDIAMEDYKKDGLDAAAYVTAGGEGYIDFPMLYYKGYRARDIDSGKMLSVDKGENYDVRVMIPAGFQGNIRVWYAGMWYWRAAEAASVIAGIGFLGYYGVVKSVRRTWRSV